jgi:predicted Zn finger-like uncharacterized protein
LFTQCSKCDTVFRLSAETLRAAGGQVRCGRCGEIFNALARLAEEPSAFPPAESALEMEARADEILQSSAFTAPRPKPDPALAELPSGDFARLQLTEKFQEEPERPKPPPAAPKPEARATAPTAPPPKPPAEASRAAPVAKSSRVAAPAASEPAAQVAVPAPPAPSGTSIAKPATPKPPAAPTTPASSPSKPAEELADDGAFDFTLPPGELDRVFVEPTPRSRSAAPAAGSEPEDAHIDALLDDSSSTTAGAHRGGGGVVSEDARREMLAGFTETSLAELEPPSAPTPALALFSWLTAAIVLALLLGAQVIRENRPWLAQHAPLRGPLHGLYAALGIAVPSAANLAAYQLRQWGVTGDPSAAGTLRVRASILNTGAQLQPYPLLRVTLANRFGARIGARDFEPTEYMGKPIVRMLAPGERADATLDILDPGKDAEGFEIDVCIRGLDQKITCAGDAAPQTKQ